MSEICDIPLLHLFIGITQRLKHSKISYTRDHDVISTLSSNKLPTLIGSSWITTTKIWVKSDKIDNMKDKKQANKFVKVCTGAARTYRTRDIFFWVWLWCEAEIYDRPKELAINSKDDSITCKNTHVSFIQVIAWAVHSCSWFKNWVGVHQG